MLNIIFCNFEDLVKDCLFPDLNWLTKSERREVYCLLYMGKNAEKLGHLSTRLLWSHQLSFMFFQQAVLIVISQLYQSSIDQLLLDKLQKVWELRVKMWLTIQWDLSFFLWEHVFPECLTWIITYFHHTCSSPMESDCSCRKKQWLPLGCCDPSTLCVTVIAAG